MCKRQYYALAQGLQARSGAQTLQNFAEILLLLFHRVLRLVDLRLSGSRQTLFME
jgi:hypothetical protein